jgi:hypothetical protein
VELLTGDLKGVLSEVGLGGFDGCHVLSLDEEKVPQTG